MENNLQKRIKKPGLTLIEVIISVALLAILSLPVFITVNTNVKLSQKTELSQQATVVGQRVLEYLGSASDITLEDSNTFSSIGLELSFSKDQESNMFVSNGKTKQGFDMKIKLKKLIENELSSDDSLSSNDLMKNPKFIITEDNNKLMVNENVVSSPYKLVIDSSLISELCGNETTCMESIYTQGLAIEVIGEITGSYNVLVENRLNQVIKIYVQFEDKQPKNITFTREKGQMEISYLTKAPTIPTVNDELVVEQTHDLYEIDVLITSDKVDGTLFKGNTVSSLNIYEKEQEGE